MRTKNFTWPPKNSTREAPWPMQPPKRLISRLNVSSTFCWSSDPSWPDTLMPGFLRFGAATGAASVFGVSGGGSEPPHAAATSGTARARARAARLAFEHVLGDDDALDFTRSLVDFGDSGVAIVSLHPELGRVPVTPVDLNRFVGDARRGLGCEQLGLGAFERMANVVVLHRCRAQGQQARGIELHGHVGQHELNGLQVGDGPAEGLSLLGIGHRFLER